MLPAAIVAWPTASMSLKAPEPTVKVIYEQELKAASDPEAERVRYLALFAQEYTPEGAAKEFPIGEIIDPRQTGAFLCQTLALVLARWNAHVGVKLVVYP